MPGDIEVRLHGAGGPAGGGDGVDLAEVATHPVKNLIALGGEPGPPSLPGYQPGFSSQGRNCVNPSSIALGAECDLRAIRRIDGLVFVGLVACKPDGLSGADQLHPDVEVSVPAAVRGK